MPPQISPTCVSCGYDLAGLELDGPCPECGATSPGILVETPLTVRRWLSEAACFVRAPIGCLRRPIVRGRADVWTSIANLAVGLGLVFAAASLPFVADAVHEAQRYNWRLGTARDVAATTFVCLLSATGGGLVAGILLSVPHRALVHVTAAPSIRISRHRRRAVLAVSSYPVLVTGAVVAGISTAIFALILARGPAPAGGSTAAWAVWCTAPGLVAALVVLVVATLVAGRARRR